MKFELVDSIPTNAVIKVFGVGGGGGNAVKHMITKKIDGVEFICANTDAQALRDINAKMVLQLGGGKTKGLGAGANPDVGRQAAMDDRERITEILRGTDMVFITAGMGGGTGTGGAPVVAQIAKEMGILTVAVVTKPFPFEGRKRMAVAMEGIAELSQHVDSLITIPNEKLLSVMGTNTSLLTAFEAANNVLLGAVQGIADLIIRPGMINVDFADVRTVMSEMGMAMMGTGHARGENRAREATEAALGSPLLDDVNLQGARGILVNITAGIDLSLGEYSEVGDTIANFASENATVVIGTVIDPEMNDEIRVTLVATGLDSFSRPQVMPTKVVDNTPALQQYQKEQYQKDQYQKEQYQKEQYQRERQAQTPRAASYSELDRPTVMRNQPAPAVQAQAPQPSMAAPAPRVEIDEDLDYLDIPAFLRRQAD